MTRPDPRLDLVAFETHHVIGSKVNPAQAKHAEMFGDPHDFAGGWSAFYEGELIAIGAARLAGDTVGGAVLFSDKITPRRFLAFHNALLGIIKNYEAKGLTPFVHIDPDYPQAQRWAELMGFSQVGFDEVGGRTMQRFER